MPPENDTICAVSSPTGEGGIGIIRMSGPSSRAVLRALFRPRKRVRSFASHRLYLGFIFDPATRADVDEVFAVFMDPPRTYTREEMAEVYSHGGPASQKAILDLMTGLGARLAEPGEFTRRAFESGRIDLAQAESVLDIIQSESEDELRCALSHVKGALSERVNGVKGAITSLLAEVEAEIDFPEEELESDLSGRRERIEAVRLDLESPIASYDEGRALKAGVDVLIAGRTNVGKSSLLNALARRERAIVTPLPGTTRDLVEDTVRIKGVKFVLTDTAGLGRAADAIEKEGMERVMRRIPEADIVLWVVDSSQPYGEADEDVYTAIREKTTIAVLNKADLPERIEADRMDSKGVRMVVHTSALTGSGLDALRAGLYEVFTDRGHRGAALLVTNVRHRDALVKADEALARACLRLGEGPGGGAEFLAFELRDALASLGAITGETATEEVLAEIFSRFCIGK